MSRFSALARILLSIVLASSLLFAQDKKKRDSYDQYGYDSERQCERNRPRTSALDYLFLPGFPGSRTGLPVAVGGLNVVTAMPFHLDRYFRVGHVGLTIMGAHPGSHAYTGIYDSHGNLLVQGKFSTDEAGDFTVEVSPRVLLKPGMYFFAIGGEDTSTEAAGYLFDEGSLNFIHSGTAANQIMDGSLPATLGPITPPQPGSTPSAVFTP